MSSEGSREIEGARKRLAAAKTMMDSAKALLDTTEKEFNEAQTALDEAEKRWEVIDIDDDDDTNPPKKDSSRNKRRKVSPAPGSSSDNTNMKVKPDRGYNSRGPLSVTVEGCRLPEINGTYNQRKTHKQSASDYLHNGALMYQRQGVEWKGSKVCFVFYRFENRKTWGIGATGGTASILQADHNSTSLTPPENGWRG